MSYNTDKGKHEEWEISNFLNEIFSRFGYEFKRIGGAEKMKSTIAGDVALIKKKDTNCVLDGIYLEVKKQASPNIWKDFGKAEQDAMRWGKASPILFTCKQAKGEKGKRLVVMNQQTFQKIIYELQSYRDTTKE